MAIDFPMNKMVVFDFNKYTGGFEHNFTGFVTGLESENCNAYELVEMSEKEIEHSDWYEDNVIEETNEFGGRTHCTIWDTPNRFNNGMGFIYSAGQEQEAIKHYIKDTEEYNEYYLKIYKARLDAGDYQLGESPDAWTKKALEEYITEYEKSNEEARAMTVPHKYAAYESIAIFVEEFPSRGVLDEMIARAKEYCELPENTRNKHPKLLGVRFLEPTYEVKEIEFHKIN